MSNWRVRVAVAAVAAVGVWLMTKRPPRLSEWPDEWIVRTATGVFACLAVAVVPLVLNPANAVRMGVFALWLCLGALLGFGCLSHELLRFNDGYDHGQGETVRWEFIGALVGVAAALSYWLLRELHLASRPKPNGID